MADAFMSRTYRRPLDQPAECVEENADDEYDGNETTTEDDEDDEDGDDDDQRESEATGTGGKMVDEIEFDPLRSFFEDVVDIPSP